MIGLSPRPCGRCSGASRALEAVEEVAGTTLTVPAGLSTTVSLPEDRTKVVTPPTLKDVGLESSHRVERVDAAGHLSLRTVQGSSVVFAPRGLPHSLSRCLWGRPVLILN